MYRCQARAITRSAAVGSTPARGSLSTITPIDEQDGGDAHRVLAVAQPGLQHRARLALDRGGRVTVGDAGVGLQDLGEGPVGKAVPVRQAAAPHDPGAVGLQGRGDLVREPALADPGRPDDRRKARTALAHGAVEEQAEQVELGAAADHRRGELRRPRPACLELLVDLVRAEGSIHALHLDLAERDERERPPRVPPGALPDDDAPGRRERLEARCDVDGLAGDEPLVVAAAVREHLAGVDPDPHRQVATRALAEVHVQLAQASLHR